MLDTYLQEVTYLERKEINIDKSGKRKVKEQKVDAYYVLVRVNKEVIENEDGSVTKKFPSNNI